MSIDVYDGRTIVSGDQGPPGVPAAQDIPLSFSNGYHANEVLPGVSIAHGCTITAAKSVFTTLTKPTGVVTITIRQNTTAIGVATMDPATCGAGPVFRGNVSLTTDPTQISSGDRVDWVIGSTVDATMTEGALTLGSI